MFETLQRTTREEHPHVRWLVGTFIVLSIELGGCLGNPHVGEPTVYDETKIQKLQAQVNELNKQAEHRPNTELSQRLETIERRANFTAENLQQIQDLRTSLEALKDQIELRDHAVLDDDAVLNTRLTTLAEGRLSMQVNYSEQIRALSQQINERLNLLETHTSNPLVDNPVDRRTELEESFGESGVLAGELMLQIYLWVPVLLGIFLMLCLVRAIFILTRPIGDLVTRIVRFLVMKLGQWWDL